MEECSYGHEERWSGGGPLQPMNLYNDPMKGGGPLLGSTVEETGGPVAGASMVLGWPWLDHAWRHPHLAAISSVVSGHSPE